MKKPKKKYAMCPCCSVEKHKTEMTVCISILKKFEERKYNNHKKLAIDTYYSFIDSNFEWACDTCLKEKKAIIANPDLQFTAWDENLAYSDKNMKCNSCGGDFTFTKEEKQLWYEKLQFHVDSEPVNCLKCRGELRLLKSENKILSDILKKPVENITIEEFKAIAEIYGKWGKEDKVKYYEAMIKKKEQKSNK